MVTGEGTWLILLATAVVALFTEVITFWMAELRLFDWWTGGCWYGWCGCGGDCGCGLGDVFCFGIGIGIIFCGLGVKLLLLPNALVFYRYYCYVLGFGLIFNPDLGNMSYFSSWLIFYTSKGLSLAFFSYLTRSAYFKVFKVFYELLLLGDIFPIITVRQYPVKESFSTIVNLLPLKGVWFLFWSNALIHYFNASKLLFIYAPSILVCFMSWSAWSAAL